MKTCIEGALLLVLALFPAVVAAASWPDPPLPPKTDTTDVARHIIFNGLDMHAHVFRSQQSQADIVAFYRETWGKEVVVNPLGSAQVIGHQQGDYYITVQVSHFGNGSKGNIGIVDTATARKDFVPGRGLPAPMGSRVFNDILYPDDQVPTRTVAMRNSLSPGQNTTYFRDHLVADGWKPADADHCSVTPCVMRYDRGDSKLTLLVMGEDAGRSQVMINVLQP